MQTTEKNHQQREMLSSRLGFLLLSAGCAIGLGNVWRFPYITGNYGGAIFVVVYLFCIFSVLPIMIMEFAVGRASRLNLGLALQKLEPAGTQWHRAGCLSLVSTYCVMMFYTTVTGWILSYCWYMASGQLANLSPDAVGAFFGATLSQPVAQIAGMSITVLLGTGVCAMGLQRGVERVVKYMMFGLIFLLILLAVRSLLLPGAMEGVRFYLVPSWERFSEAGIFNVCSAAMSQAFFTLSIGFGAGVLFGSYQDKTRSLTNEGLWVMGLDTFVAIIAGLIIFPACFAFNVQPDQGPGLVFVTLPNIFNSMTGGRLWGTLFFIFMAFAALSSVIAMSENIISYSMDVWKMSRWRAVVVHTVLLWLTSLPCALGFNVLDFIQPLGANSSILDLEDFIINRNLFLWGGVLIIFFCCHRSGWSWQNFLAEANQGRGIKFPAWTRFYLTWILPCLVLFLFIVGYIETFVK